MLFQIRTLCVSPDGQLLLSVDEHGRALLIARRRRVLLHHFSFKSPVTAAAFSPDGRYIAAAVGRLLQVWHAPPLAKALAPMSLHRTYGTAHDTITCLDWSPDGAFIAVGAKDLTVRVFSLHPIPGWTPPTLSGHKDSPVGVFWADPRQAAAAAAATGGSTVALYSVARDGGLYAWTAVGSNDSGGDNSNADGRSVAVAGSGASAAVLNASTAPPGPWSLAARHFFMQRGARLSAAAMHAPSGILVAGFSNGLFELLQLPDFAVLQTLSVSQQRISAAAFSAAGDWLALGCAKLGQLLVWEWRSESYVLRQQGHYYDVSCACYSPDGAIIATGAPCNAALAYICVCGCRHAGKDYGDVA